MAKFDWNEIVVTNDANIANGQVKDRMILVTGEKGDKGKDGRSIVDVKETGKTATYNTYTVFYSDGTKSTFSIDLVGNSDERKVYSFYLDAVDGNDENIGSFNAPFKTIRRALEVIPEYSTGIITILSEGNYCTSGFNLIFNRTLTVLVTSENVDLGAFSLGNTRLTIDANCQEFTVGHIDAKDSTVKIENSNQDLYRMFVKTTKSSGAISLDNSDFVNLSQTKFMMTGEGSRTGVVAVGDSHALFGNIEFTGTMAVALQAESGANIFYKTISGDSLIQHREVINDGFIQSITNNNYIYYIDGDNGDDSNTGVSISSPFKTLQTAADLIPNNCNSSIVLLGGDCGNVTFANKIINFDIQSNTATVGTIDATNSKISTNDHLKISTAGEYGIILNNSWFSASYGIEIEITNTNSAYGIKAINTSEVHLLDIEFHNIMTVALQAETGSVICYTNIIDNGYFILNREVLYAGFIYKLNTQENIMYYVDGQNGSDVNTGTDIDSPFKTLQKAIDLIPNNDYTEINLLGGNCGNGNFTDKVIALNISGDDVVIGDLTLNRSNVSINNQNKALTVGAIEATDSAMSIAASFTLTTDKNNGISLTGSRFYSTGSITFEMTGNSVRRAIYATEASHAAFWRIHCRGTMTTAIYSSSGSIVGYASLDGDSTILHNEVKEYGGRIYSGIQDEGGNAAIAEEFDSTQNYQIGDYVVYDNNLYRFTTEHPAGNWNSNHVSKIHVADELNEKVSKEPQDGKLYARRNNQWEEIVTTVDEPITLSTKDNIAYCFEGTKDDESAELVVELAPNNTKYLTNFLKHKMITYYASDGKNLIELYNKQNYDLPHTDTFGALSVTTNPDGSFTLNGSTSIERELHIGYVKNCQGVNLRITGSVNSSQGFFHVYCEASTSGGSGGYDEGNGATFTGVTDKMPVWIHFAGEFQNATFYPMVRVASFGDDEFEEPITNNLEDASVLDISSYDIYGGYVNFKTGTIVKTWGYIQSYNGEEITDEWISYGGGATPQTGAEVVYKLATPIEYHFDPLAIPTYNDKTTIILYCVDEEDSQYKPEVVYIKNGVMLDDYAKQTKALIDKKADKLLVAKNFDATENYSVGDIVFYSESGESKLYRFTVEHPAGNWNQSHVEETTIATELGNKTSGKNINSIVLSQSGAEYDTYRVTFSDETTLDFQIVKNTENFYTKQAVDNFLFNKADAIKEYGERTVKGKEIYIPAGATVTDFKVYLEPFQTGEGEPSATNIQPVYETSEVEIQKKNIGGNWVHVDTLSAVKYVYNNQQTYGTIIDYLNRKSRSSWALIPNYTGESLPGRWVSDRDVYSGFAPTGQPSVGAQVAYEKATPESAEDLFRTDSEMLYNFNQSEPYLLRAHYWHEYSQYDAEFVMEVTYKADVPVDTKTYVDDKHDALREEMYSNLGTITTENTSDTHWMKLENTRSNQIIKKLQIEYKPSLTGIDWIEVGFHNKNLIGQAYNQINYGSPYNGITFTQNSDNSISFSGTPTSDIDIQFGSVEYLPPAQYYLSGGINENCYLYVGGASEIKSTGADTLFTAHELVNLLSLKLFIKNTGEEVSGTFYPMVRFKDDDATYVKPISSGSLWERLGTELDRKPAYGFTYDFVTATLTETWKHIDSYNFEPNPFPRRWIADDYTETSPYSGASVTYELVEPEVREEDNKYANQHLVDGVTYLFANNSNIVISEVIAEIRVDDFVEGLISGKADKTEVYTKTQTDEIVSDMTDAISEKIDDAPNDGNMYVRQNGQWVQLNLN